MAKYINPYTDFGFKSAIETAVEEAVEEKQIEIAKSLLDSALSNEEISKHTSLTIKQIEQLRNEKK